MRCNVNASSDWCFLRVLGDIRFRDSEDAGKAHIPPSGRSNASSRDLPVRQSGQVCPLGRKTASGEMLDSVTATAAHRSLPLTSLARVTDLDNGRSIIVKINDRGPYARGRIIDLSPRAADALGMKAAGVAAVQFRPFRTVPKQTIAVSQSRGKATRIKANDPAAFSTDGSFLQGPQALRPGALRPQIVEIGTRCRCGSAPPEHTATVDPTRRSLLSVKASPARRPRRKPEGTTEQRSNRCVLLPRFGASSVMPH